MSFSSEVSFIEDRFTQGFLAGIAGWLPEVIFTFSNLWIFHLTKFGYLDFAAIITYNHKPQGFLQHLFSELVVIIVLTFLGAVFAMLIKVIQSPAIILKGTLYGAISWFLIYVLFALYKIEGISGKIDFPTAVINLLGAAIWGIGMAWTLLFLNRKYGVKN